MAQLSPQYSSRSSSPSPFYQYLWEKHQDTQTFLLLEVETNPQPGGKYKPSVFSSVALESEKLTLTIAASHSDCELLAWEVMKTTTTSQGKCKDKTERFSNQNTDRVLRSQTPHVSGCTSSDVQLLVTRLCDVEKKCKCCSFVKYSYFNTENVFVFLFF